MSLYEQKKEIETIKERNITVKLSDADCERLANKCGEHNLTIGELLGSFIGDLVDGTYSNGSDERDMVDTWFERCWFVMYPERTLLNHLISFGYDPEEHLKTLDNIETYKEDRRYLEEHPEQYKGQADLEDEFQFIDNEIEMWEEELKSMRNGWRPDTEPKMEDEIEKIKKWVEDKNNLLNGKKITEGRKTELQRRM